MNEVFITRSNGQIVNKSQLAKLFNSLPPDGRFLVKVESKNKRTSPQNRYLHMMFYLIHLGFQDIGYREVRDAEIAKEIMKRRFLSVTIDNGTGGKIEIVKRTRDLTKEEMSQFIDECIQFAAENLNVVIPRPAQPVSSWEAEFDENVPATIVT